MQELDEPAIELRINQVSIDTTCPWCGWRWTPGPVVGCADGYIYKMICYHCLEELPPGLAQIVRWAEDGYIRYREKLEADHEAIRSTA